MTATASSPRVVDHPDPEERVAKGRPARAAVPRASHAGWDAPSGRQSPVDVLLEQAKSRVPELIPIRHARMTASPFAFYRGAAAVMAADLAGTPVSGLRAQICGDAHLANFGGFAAPDRTLVFDVNDFDETAPGPWEWDVKRLAASFEIAARSRDFDAKIRKRVVRRAVRSYRDAMRILANTRNLDLWYTRLDETNVFEKFGSEVNAREVERFQKNLLKARGKDSLKAFAKLTERVDGEIRIVSNPPLIVRLEDLMPDGAAEGARDFLRAAFRDYRSSLQPDRRHLVEGYELVDIARKVVGVGSVGTRCWVALMMGRDDNDPLFLQIKEAEASVLEAHVGRSQYTNHGRRVVEGQRYMQSASDIFLGWDHFKHPDGSERDFYVRQMWDGKFSAQIEIMEPEVMSVYADMCGSTLARAHARSGDRIAIASYLGSGDTFDRAVAEFSDAYADQNQRDYETVIAAVESGVLEAHEDVPG